MDHNYFFSRLLPINKIMCACVAIIPGINLTLDHSHVESEPMSTTDSEVSSEGG